MYKRNMQIVVGAVASIFIVLIIYFVVNRGESLAFVSLDQGGQLRNFPSQTRKPVILVFTNVDEVGNLLPQLVPHLPDSLPVENQLQQINYEHSLAILVLQGQNGGNSSVQVQHVVRKDNRLIVYAQFITPRAGGQTANVTDAYHLIAIPKDGSWNQQVEFDLVEDRFFGGVVAETTHFIP